MTAASRVRIAAVAALTTLLALPAAGMAAGAEFDPSEEFKLDPWVSIELGPLDLSINKAVFYLFLASVICIAMGLVIRGGLKMKPTKSQNIVEMAYEFAEKQIARPTLTTSVYNRYFPYIATLFLFILVSNLVSFIPLPVSHASWIGPIPDFALYAATANINVTLALTVVTFLVYNYEGVRAHGVLGYLKTLVPDAPKAIQPIIFGIEVLSQILRLVSLSVRLFANLLAGHLLIIMAAGFMVLLGNFFGLIALPVGVFFWVFEWLLVAGLQAFIFAMLSGIYIGFAVESSH
ncbi:F0F1 ATP synthase subunit A [Miltoncostaea oceani]|uniref:F0F1 ATP synthase subunit A n=1 Tax=Miltoncostaea oceani TaxID=2843216 RepID=UPI001C3CEE50|nr:F0F1 ATP synthase subunit A [Miltoncostaea oceani]